MSGELIAILAVGVAGARRDARRPGADAAINGRLQSLGERVARIEGRLEAGAVHVGDHPGAQPAT